MLRPRPARKDTKATLLGAKNVPFRDVLPSVAARPAACRAKAAISAALVHTPRNVNWPSFRSLNARGAQSVPQP